MPAGQPPGLGVRRGTGLASLRELRGLGLAPWSWAVPPSGPSATAQSHQLDLEGGGLEAPELAGGCVGWRCSPALCCPSTLGWLVLSLPPFLRHRFSGFSPDGWSPLSAPRAPHLSSSSAPPRSLPRGRRGPPAWGAPTSTHCMACGRPVWPPGPRSCSAPFSPTRGALEEQRLASLPGALRRGLDPGGPLGSSDHCSGCPEGWARLHGSCPVCGSPELPLAPCSSCPGAGPLPSPARPLLWARVQGVGCACAAFCVDVVGACVLSTSVSVRVCPRVCPRVSMCMCIHVCGFMSVSPCVCVHTCLCISMSVCVRVSVHVYQYMSMRVSVCVHAHVSLCACVHMSVGIHACVHVSVCVCVFMSVCPCVCPCVSVSVSICVRVYLCPCVSVHVCLFIVSACVSVCVHVSVLMCLCPCVCPCASVCVCMSHGPSVGCR